MDLPVLRVVARAEEFVLFSKESAQSADGTSVQFRRQQSGRFGKMYMSARPLIPLVRRRSRID